MASNVSRRSYHRTPASTSTPATVWLAALVLACMSTPAHAGPSRAATRDARQPAPDGQHDFAFVIGTWTMRMDGVEASQTVVARPVWNGLANLEETGGADPAGVQQLVLRLYNRTSHEWHLYRASSDRGMLRPPLVGRFVNGTGEFVDQESVDGRTRLVRQVYSDMTPTAYRVAQSSSDDGARTWTPNWTATLTRVSSTPLDPRLDARRPRDFDFNIGTFATQVSRLPDPLTSSRTWTDYDGTSRVRPVWGGRASLLELDVVGAAGRIEGAGLRLFDPRSGQWRLNWTTSDAGVMQEPMVGGFTEGRGEFVAQERFRGRAILARNRFIDITPEFSRFEQDFSADGGTRWEINWVMTFIRVENGALHSPRRPNVEERDGQHDFDFILGKWEIRLRRLERPLSGSTAWLDFQGTVVARPLWDGRANVEEFSVVGPTGRIEGLTLRLYNPDSRQWRLYWAIRNAGAIGGPPTVGAFKDGRGEFFAQDTFNGRTIFVRYVWSKITPTSAHFEQSFSDDGGGTWEVNWVTDQTRIRE